MNWRKISVYSAAAAAMLTFASGCSCGCCDSATSVAGLSVNRLVSPSDVTKPVFAWKMKTSRSGARQQAYRIEVKDVSGKTVWDSGVVKSPVSVGVDYAGPALESASGYGWRVSVQDEQGKWASADGSFSTGLIKASDWDGSEWIAVPGVKIISSNDVPAMVKAGLHERSVPGTSCFVKSLDLGKGVKQAMWTVTGQGVFEAYVNGRRVGEDFLKPGFTHVFKTRHSFTYDVTAMLRKSGANVFAAEVSAGWWRDKIVHYRGRESAFRAQLVVRYADGSEKRFGTDATWLGAIAGCVERASIFEGEVYDARKSSHWADGTDKAGFKPVKTIDEFKGAIIPMEGPAISLREDLALGVKEAYVWKEASGVADDRFGKVVKLREYAEGDCYTLEPGEKLVVDFAQNAAAVPRFTAQAAAGTELKFLPAEMLNDDDGLKSRGNDGPEGSTYRVNLRRIHDNGAMAVYTFSGKGKETYMPRFTFFGYRYATIEVSAKTVISKLESVPVTSVSKDLELGSFKTGVKDLNRLVSNVLWGQYSNYLSVPTDCPQRNERLGWSADTQVFCSAGAYNADVYGFLAKWMRDLRDSQHEDGSYTGVAPVAQYGHRIHELGWSDAGVIVPHTMWKRFGDTTIIKDNWDSMVRFVKVVSEVRYTNEYARTHQWADWLSYEALETCSGKANGRGLKGAEQEKAKRDSRFYWKYLGGCYWLWDARMMEEMATAIGKKNEAEMYKKMSAEALAYLRKEFVQADGMLPEVFRGMQTPALFALKLGLLSDPKAVEKTKKALLKNFADHGDCLQTGFLGTSILMDTVTYDVGAPEMAYTLLLQRKNPSWLYSVDQGATTIWERWNSYVKATGFGPVGMNSFNHYAYGAVLNWMYATMAGIRDDGTGSGYRHFILAPIPDRRVGSVDASYDSPYGVIRSSWKYDGDKWTWRFTIPANTTATVTVPGGKTEELGPGSYVRIK